MLFAAENCDMNRFNFCGRIGDDFLPRLVKVLLGFCHCPCPVDLNGISPITNDEDLAGVSGMRCVDLVHGIYYLFSSFVVGHTGTHLHSKIQFIHQR